MPPPPPNVDTNLPPFDESKPLTNRERLGAHTTSKVCASCHNLVDPIGFGLEKFDAIGIRREQQKLLFYPAEKGDGKRRGKPKEVLLNLDTSARVAGVPNSEFTTGRQLGEILAPCPAMSGVHGQTSIPLHCWPTGDGGRSSGSKSGVGNISKVGF